MRSASLTPSRWLRPAPQGADPMLPMQASSHCREVKGQRKVRPRNDTGPVLAAHSAPAHTAHFGGALGALRGWTRLPHSPVRLSAPVAPPPRSTRPRGPRPGPPPPPRCSASSWLRRAQPPSARFRVLRWNLGSHSLPPPAPEAPQAPQALLAFPPSRASSRAPCSRKAHRGLQPK